MQIFICSIFLLAILAIPVITAPTESAREAILRLEQEWQDALISADVAALDRLYAETMIYTHSNGSVDDKKSYIESLRSGTAKYQSMTRDEIKVQIFGDSAIVTCHWQVSSVSGTKVNNTNARYLHFYTRQNGKWRMVAHQATRIIQ
ncbi:MAG: nuclear transport factor 2 family protein [Blastocatellia bacterium]|jgi:uncharacterized protein (TIGR02246 family)